ncbi:Mismatch-specific thymine-DNA glycosylase, putative [Penicillium digitatum]|uniref:Mismatch-specific thymine-DNA glycosylase, putative n=1 Tax=Penicillium digitatum TaxID=36651 RepID=A0A7T6XRT0_PENDI|nr:Mismatch-specific thymine-DNA glycosylase, putative [Penicillium digitatum]
MPPFTGIQAKVEEDEVILETVEDVPVNKITSFNGKLQQYLHSGTTAHQGPSTSRATISQRRINAAETGNKPHVTGHQAKAIISSPRRKRTVSRSTESDSTTTLLRTTRSQSILTTTPPSPNKRKRRSVTPNPPQTLPIAGPSATESLLRDTIPPNLILLLVGVNPGIMTGITGPADTYKLPALYNVGNTNIVERPTRDASMLSRAEMDAGVPVLEAKIAAQRPEVVGLVGKSIWEAVWRVKHGRGIRKEEFRYGWQAEVENMGRGDGWAGAPVFVATTTSGLAAGMKPAEKEAVWAELGSWVVKRRGERGH